LLNCNYETYKNTYAYGIREACYAQKINTKKQLSTLIYSNVQLFSTIICMYDINCIVAIGTYGSVSKINNEYYEPN